MMNDCIDRFIKYVILCIVRLCKIYEQNDDAQTYMKEKGNILFDLLVKTVCASLLDKNFGEWEEVVQEVRQKLENEYTYPRGAEVVRIVGGDGVSEEYIWNNFYAWSLFQYTYILVRKDEEKRKIFLWRTILLPYIHKVNKNCSEKVNDEIEKLLKKYPIVDGEGAEDKTLEKLIENHNLGYEHFWEDEDLMGGNGYVLPSRINKKAASEISQAGWECLLSVNERVKRLL